MQRLLLLDLDGTIRQSASGAKFIQHPRDQQPIAGADKAIAHYRSLGWVAIGISNQGGVAAGHKQLADAIVEQRYTLELFPQLSSIFFCPDFAGKHCWMVVRGNEVHSGETPVHLAPWGQEFIGSFRKPKPGMLSVAIKMLGYESRKADYWYVGDRTEDEAAAAAAAINFCPAPVWRDRFRPGLHVAAATRQQVQFLEGIEL